MATLNIDGRSVNVDDSFLKLSPDQQNATVDEIAKSFAPQPKLSDAVTDIPSEIGKAASENIDTIKKGITDRGTKGPIEGLMDTGKAVLAIPGLLASPLTGAVRSLIGHPMAQAEHAVGTLINPDVAAKDDPAKMYAAAKGDVDTAMSALRPGGVIGKVPAPAGAVRGPYEIPADQPAYGYTPPAGEAAPVASKPVAPTIAELKASASGKPGMPGGYEGTELSNLEVKPTAISDFATKTKVALDAGGLDENLAPKTHAILSKLEKIPDSPSATVTGNNIKSLRQLLGNAAGEPGKEGVAASKALNALDDHIPAIEPKDVISGDPKAAGEALDTANADYSAAKHAETIDNKAVQAELRAAAANSGHNVANTIRQRMADILIKPDLQRGFHPDELAFMDKIVRGTKTQNALRLAGNLMGGGGGLGAAVTGGIGAIATPGGVGGLIPVAGYALKALSNHLALRDVGKLSEMIRSRAPLASSMQKFDESAGQFSSRPTAKSYASALIAARNFSANLRGASINISPSDLLKGLQSPGPAQADDQQNIPWRRRQ